MGTPRVSLVVSTYEKPRELALSLRSAGEAARKLDGELELLVADDGSGPGTREIVHAFARSAPFAVKHVYQRDEGFRLAAIRNRAIRLCSGEVVVFLDGDSLLHPDALRLHAMRCRPRRAHSGHRIQMGEQETARLLEGELEWSALVRRVAARDRPRRYLTFTKNLVYRATRLKVRPKLIGGNCAVHRSDLEAVNGFDERFVGWGLEDDDLLRRLKRHGVRVADGSLDCLVVHLHHEVHPSHFPTVRHTENYRYYHRARVLSRCRRGLRSRPLDDIRFRIVGMLPRALEALESRLGRPGPGETVEVVLVAGAERTRPREARVREDRAEVVLRLDEVPAGGEHDALDRAVDFIENAL